MENPGRLSGCRLAAMILWCWTTVWWLHAASVASASGLWMVEFPALPGGGSCEAAMVWLSDPPLLVTVVPTGANPMRPMSGAANPRVNLRAIGHDPVSRLGFFEATGTDPKAAQPWLKEAGGAVGGSLKAITADGPLDCRVTGWVKQVGDKVLPLALLSVSFQGPVPAPGTALVDAQNRVAALVFQNAGGDRSAYAIPAEAVHRVRRDISDGGVLVRGWLGLTLHAQNPSPRVVRVLPDSPAAAADIRADDVLLQVGSRTTREYPDVSDAFFYLIPGQPVPIAVQRGGRRLDLTITPARPR